VRDQAVGGATETLILSSGDIAGLMDQAAWLEAAETAFGAAAAGAAWSPPPMHIEADGGAFHAKGAALRLDRLYVAVKLNGNFPANPAARGLPTIQGAILLSDGSDGSLLAILDSIEVTIRRTAAATALAARYLARADSSTLLVCGCGEQGRAQLEALAAALPLTRALAWDIDGARARAFAGEMELRLGIETTAAADLPAAARISDAIVACTPSISPYLGRTMVAPGAFVAAVGADSPAKSELCADLFEGTRVVADVLGQCETMGDLRHAIAAGAIARDQVHAELAELVGGTKLGRRSADEITVFDSTGTALQDVAAAALIYRRSLGRALLPTVALGSR
jgi:ornithine cyclodeaminase/alanine dehydrogenase-like protein (mu-crystallin family)